MLVTELMTFSNEGFKKLNQDQHAGGTQLLVAPFLKDIYFGEFDSTLYYHMTNYNEEKSQGFSVEIFYLFG